MNEEKHLHHVIASPDGAISFLFCIFAIMNGYCAQNQVADSALFSIGAVQSLISVFALIAALINLIRGKARGNINLMASLLLGFFPGLIKLIQILARFQGESFDSFVFGFVYLIGALFCFTVAIKRRHKPLYRFIGTLCLSGAFLLEGIGSVLHVGMLEWISGIFYYIFAAEMYYFGLTIMYFYYDARLPQGPRIPERGKKS